MPAILTPADRGDFLADGVVQCTHPFGHEFSERRCYPERSSGISWLPRRSWWTGVWNRYLIGMLRRGLSHEEDGKAEESSEHGISEEGPSDASGRRHAWRAPQNLIHML